MPFNIKDIAGGIVFILLLIVVAFVLMSGFSYFTDTVEALLRRINSPVITIIVIISSIILIGIIFSLAKMSEFGFNIKRFLNDLKNHFKER